MLAYGDMPEGACRLWAFLMVYFFIVALFWGSLEALLVMLKMKSSNFGEGFLTRNYVWIAMPVAWGMYVQILKEHIIMSENCLPAAIPVIPALISLGGLNYYGEQRV